MSILRLRMALPVLILAGATACDRSVQPNQIIVRDSAGVQIAELDWRAVPTAWQVDSIAEWSVGANDQTGAGLELHDVRDAMILGDSSVVIAEGSTQEVIWAGPRGELVRRVGGRGDGPDQFRGMSKVFDDGGGGIFIFDSTRKRYVRFSREGALLEEATAPVEIGTILGSHRTAGGGWYLLSDGPFEETGVARNGAGEEVGKVRRPRAALIRAEFDGSQAVDSIATVLGFESVVGPAVMGILGFAATGLVAGSSEEVWLGDTKRPEVSLWSDSAQPRWVVRWADPSPRVVDESVRDELWSVLGALASAEELAGMRAVLPFSEEIPAFESLLTGEDGKLWIGAYASYMAELFEAPQRAQEWLVLDLENGLAGKVVTPPGLRVLRTGREYVLGVHRDELGVESVRRYRLAPL